MRASAGTAPRGAAVALCVAIAILATPATADVVYLYDALGRLVRVIDQSGEAGTYVYDDVGNITRIARQSGIPQDQTGLTSVTPALVVRGGRATLTFTGINLAGAGLPDLPACLTLVSSAFDVNGDEDVLSVTVDVDPECPPGPTAVTLVSALGETPLRFSLDVRRAAPAVSRVLPPVVATGGLVQIEGARFDASSITGNQVAIHGVPLRVLSARADTLIVQVPAGVISGPVTVTTDAGSGVSETALTVVSGAHPQQNVVTATLQSPFRGPTYAAFSPDGARAWVMNTGRTSAGGIVSDTGGGVAAIDTAQDRVLKTLPIGSSSGPGASAVTVTPDGRRALVTSVTPAALTIIDAASLAVTTTIAYPAGARDVVVSPDGRLAYVSIDSPALSVVDLVTLAEVARIPLSRQALFVAVTPDGATVYGIRGDMISIVDTATRLVTRTITTTLILNVISFALDPDAQRLYLGGFSSGSGFPFVLVVDLETGATVRTIPGFAALALSPDRLRLYLASSQSPLTVLDTASFTTMGTVAIGTGRPSIFARQALLTSADGATLAVVNVDDNTVSLIEAGPLALIGHVPVGLGPVALVAVPGRSDLYVLNAAGNTVSVLDLAARAVRPSALEHFGLAEPLGVVASLASPYALVANRTAATTVAFTPSTGAGLATLAAGDSHPGVHVATALSRGEIYVGNATPAGVWVLDLQTREPKRLLRTPRPPRAIALSVDERRLYVASDLNTNLGTQLTVVDAATGAVIVQLTLDPARPTDDVVLDTEGQRFYVLHPPGGGVTSGVVRVVDTATASTITTIPVSTAPVRLAFGHAARRLYAINAGSVTVIDPVTNAVVTTIAIGGFTNNNMVFSLDGRTAYLAGSGVRVIDTATNAVTATIAAGFVRAIALSPDGQRLFASTEFSPGQLHVIDTVTEQVIATRAIGGSSTTAAPGMRSINVAFAPDGTRAWVVNLLDDSITVIE